MGNREEEREEMKWLRSLCKRASLSWISTLGIDELIKIRQQATESIGWMQHVQLIFPGSLFLTTLRSTSLIKEFGPKCAFVIFYNRIKDIDKFRELQYFVTPRNVEFCGYARSSGYDETFYRYQENKWIPIEKDDWLYGTGEDIENLIDLIWFNVIKGEIDPEIIWRKYSSSSRFQKALEEINDKDIGIKNGEKLILEAIPEYLDDNLKNDLIVAYNKWWWSRKSTEFLQESINKAIDEFKDKTEQEQISAKPSEDPYVYNISMNPRTEGNGKFIDFELTQQAYEMYGDFNITVRYNNGRVNYSASQIIEFLKPEHKDDDMAFNFFNQLDGIRDMYIARNQS